MIKEEILLSLLKKYEVDEDKARKILEEAKNYKTIKLEKGMYYEIAEGILIGRDRNGNLRMYFLEDS